MASFKFKGWALLTSIANAIRDWQISCKGQSPEYEILQTAHRLEKGLLIENPRKMWGWDKANRLYALLDKTNNEFIKQTGKSVLSAYLKQKKSSYHCEDREEYDSFIKNTNYVVSENKYGGAITIPSTHFDNNELETIYRLFNTRHSARTFSEKEVPLDKVRTAINVALRCPSACNRQPFKVYAVNSVDKESKISHSTGYNGNMFLFVTGSIDAYTLDEINDWIVSPSIFVGYLTLSLHALGIGSCVVRKDLACNTPYNKAVREFCKIPNNEKIILELAIGMYNETYKIPISNRKSVDDCLIVCSKEK